MFSILVVDDSKNTRKLMEVKFYMLPTYDNR